MKLDEREIKKACGVKSCVIKNNDFIDTTAIIDFYCSLDSSLPIAHIVEKYLIGCSL